MNMNKKRTIITAVIIAALAAGMAGILLFNKMRSAEQSASASELDRSVSVSTVRAERRFIGDEFSANGISQAARELKLLSDISGRVAEIHVENGDRVAEGTVLLQLDREVYEADYLAAKAACEALRKDEQRLSRASEGGGVTLQQLDNVRAQLASAESRLTASRRRYEDAVVKSPIAGVVNSRFIEKGSLVAPNAPLFEIVDAGRVKLICHVSESRLRLLAVGQSVSAADAAEPGKLFSGRITHIGIKSDRGLNYPVEVLLERDSRLRVGAYLKVRFCEGRGHDAVTIPRRAVTGSAGSAVAYAVENGTARRRTLLLGDMAGEMVEVLEGIEEGEEIIVAGIMNIGEGTDVRIVNR